MINTWPKLQPGRKCTKQCASECREGGEGGNGRFAQTHVHTQRSSTEKWKWRPLHCSVAPTASDIEWERTDNLPNSTSSRLFGRNTWPITHVSDLRDGSALERTNSWEVIWEAGEVSLERNGAERYEPDIKEGKGSNGKNTWSRNEGGIDCPNTIEHMGINQCAIVSNTWRHVGWIHFAIFDYCKRCWVTKAHVEGGI